MNLVRRGRCLGLLNMFVFWVLSSTLGEATQHVIEKSVARKATIHPNDFLRRYGYLPKDHTSYQHSRAARKTAVSLYQQNNGLTITGKINKQTWRLMRKPRCGNPDFGVLSLPEITSHNETFMRRRQRRNIRKRAKQINNTMDFRWLQRAITWSPTRFLHKLPVASQWNALKKAFDIWSEPSQLTLTYDPRNPDIRVSFWRKEHGDGYENAFDGRGRLLAHAFPPGDLELSGDVHFDSDENWSVTKPKSKTSSSKDLLMIALHEVGHAVGLSHSKKHKDIMYPVYGSYNPQPSLSRHDVRRLRRLYGKNPAFKWKPPPSSSVDQTVAQASVRRVPPHWCRRPFNDVIRGPAGHGYIFSKRKVYRMGDKGVDPGSPLPIRDLFPGGPINAQAVVHVRDEHLTVFFKGKKIWKFGNFTLLEGYPKVLQPAFPEKPRAALCIRDRRGYSTVYIFGSRFFWQWDVDTERVTSGYLFISLFWPELPSKVDAAVHWSDTYLYFFKYNKYYKLSMDRHKLQPGYPKVKGPAWFGGKCGHEPK